MEGEEKQAQGNTDRRGTAEGKSKELPNLLVKVTEQHRIGSIWGNTWWIELSLLFPLASH